ncbi:MAG: DnaJ domain-containing protein [Oscillospiraceae bacterium]
MDSYKILGLSQGANEEEIKSAYKALAQKYSMDNYEAGPLRDEAEAKMNEINAAFDELMGNIRTGSTAAAQGKSASTAYNDIRDMINRGNAEEALTKLNAMPVGSEDAEWNFLVGSAYYYKGWLSDASRYFETACRLEPNNREYAAAMNNIKNNARGNMNGNPYAQNPYGAQMRGCSCCDMCSAMMCMDMCCGCGNGC